MRGDGVKNCLMSSDLARPRSALCLPVNLLAALVPLGVIFLCKNIYLHGILATLLALLLYILAVIGLEIFIRRRHLHGESGLDFSRFAPDRKRVKYKLVGLYGCYLWVGFFYWICPEYHDHMFTPAGEALHYYTAYGEALILVVPVMLLLSIPYVYLLDGWMVQPKDRYYWAGRFLFGRPDVDRCVVWQLALEWLGKGFFFALLFVQVNRRFNYLIDFHYADVEMRAVSLYLVLYDHVMLVGLMLALAGHALTLRLIGGQVRSMDPSLFGWWVCLWMFDPFRSLAVNYAWVQGGEDAWMRVWQLHPAWQSLGAGLSIVLLLLLFFSEVSLGSRSSYMTHRGIVTNGLFRFTKHPAYLFGWVLMVVIYLPVEGGPEGWAKGAVGAAGLGALFWLRARTEEAHLSRDAEYVRYGLWMNEHGIFAPLGRLIPFLRYRAPAGGGKAPYEGLYS